MASPLLGIDPINLRCGTLLKHLLQVSIVLDLRHRNGKGFSSFVILGVMDGICQLYPSLAEGFFL